MKHSIGAKTLVYPTPVLIIGSYDTEGRPNIMNAAWGGICSSDPPSLAVSVRPARYTHDNITSRKAFTINIPSVDFAKQADYAGIYSGRERDKFAGAGLTPVKSEVVDAPYVDEFPLVLECELRKAVDLGAHIQFIGQIMDVKVDEAILDEDGRIDMEKLKPMVFAPGNQCYYAVGSLVGPAFTIGKEL